MEVRMKLIVSEPVPKYHTKKWAYGNIKLNYNNNQFVDIKDGFALFRQPSIISTHMNRPERIKLSSLRGKLSKQTKEEIDQQLKELRNEWERNI